MEILHEKNPPPPPESLASRIRDLKVGEALILDDLSRVDSVRVAVDRIKKQTGRTFKTAVMDGKLRVWRITKRER